MLLWEMFKTYDIPHQTSPQLFSEHIYFLGGGGVAIMILFVH